MKQKFDLKPEGLQASLLTSIKAGDVIIVRPQPSTDNVSEAAVASSTASSQLGCYLPHAPEDLVGVLPASAKHLVPFGELQASVRSVKRDSDGHVQQLSLRVEITGEGPVTWAEPKPSEPVADVMGQQGLPEYITHDDGFQLRRSQLHQLVHSQDVVKQLADERLQKLLTSIDSSNKPEQALALALERPEFRDFTEQILQLLDTGLPS